MQLITDDYRRLNEKLHNTHKHYGVSGHNYANDILTMSTRLQTKDILDYGCGKCTLANCLPFSIKNYDPAIQAFSENPKAADIVVCTDVMEHIEPELLDEVLCHIHVLTKKMAYFSISTTQAKKTLEDGRNAHLIINNAHWWFNKISEHLQVLNFMSAGNGVIIYAKPVTILDRTNNNEGEKHEF